MILLPFLSAPALAIDAARYPTLVQAGEARFGAPLLWLEPQSDGSVALGFGADDTRWVMVADEPCAMGAECLGGHRVLALGTAGGQGVETVTVWSGGLVDANANGLTTALVSSISDGWLKWWRMPSPGSATSCPFSGTETELEGPTCVTEAEAGFVEAAAARAADPRTRRAITVLAHLEWTVRLGG
jgi:hypothetical protein